MGAYVEGRAPSNWRQMDRCRMERHPEAYWHRRVYQNGALHLEFYCPTCDRPVTPERYPQTKGHAVSEAWLAEHVPGVLPDELPVHRRSLRYHLCYLCGVTAQCEFHHVAPQAIYGSDAEKYPVVPLCIRCHRDETKRFTDKLETYVQERIRRFLSRKGGAA